MAEALVSNFEVSYQKIGCQTNINIVTVHTIEPTFRTDQPKNKDFWKQIIYKTDHPL
jgi:hypothetical protein